MNFIYLINVLTILLLSGCCHSILPKKQPYIIAEKTRLEAWKIENDTRSLHLRGEQDEEPKQEEMGATKIKS